MGKKGRSFSVTAVLMSVCQCESAEHGGGGGGGGAGRTRLWRGAPARRTPGAGRPRPRRRRHSGADSSAPCICFFRPPAEKAWRLHRYVTNESKAAVQCSRKHAHGHGREESWYVMFFYVVKVDVNLPYL